MKKLMTICLAAMMSVMIVGVANADWVPADGSKMHYPQLPDPQGWDISFNWREQSFADDFKCTSTGPITDIHFWVSWKGDVVGSITNITAGIYANLSNDPLWSSTFSSSQFTVKYAGSGLQGWDDPYPDSTYIAGDHTSYYQVNIQDIANPFSQVQDTTYWLKLTAWMAGGTVGWKTTLNPWGSPALYPSIASGWQPIAVGSDNHPVDLAFVITPEPATMSLLGLCALSLIRRKRCVKFVPMN